MTHSIRIVVLSSSEAPIQQVPYSIFLLMQITEFMDMETMLPWSQPCYLTNDLNTLTFRLGEFDNPWNSRIVVLL